MKILYKTITTFFFLTMVLSIYFIFIKNEYIPKSTFFISLFYFILLQIKKPFAWVSLVTGSVLYILLTTFLLIENSDVNFTDYLYPLTFVGLKRHYATLQVFLVGLILVLLFLRRSRNIYKMKINSDKKASFF